jgi:hypothetical protein
MRGMSESDERLNIVNKKIEDAETAARPLADQDIIDPDETGTEDSES